MRTGFRRTTSASMSQSARPNRRGRGEGGGQGRTRAAYIFRVHKPCKKYTMFILSDRLSAQEPHRRRGSGLHEFLTSPAHLKIDGSTLDSFLTPLLRCCTGIAAGLRREPLEQQQHSRSWRADDASQGTNRSLSRQERPPSSVRTRTPRTERYNHGEPGRARVNPSSEQEP